MADDDVDALQKGLLAGMITKRCTRFENGGTVFIDDKATFLLKSDVKEVQRILDRY